MSSLVIDAPAPRGNDLRELQRIAAFVNAALPDLAITDTFSAASQSAMLALSAQKGDLCVRSDLNQTFILKGSDPTQLANWQSLDTQIVQTLVNGDTTHSPSSDVVFDALALKAAKGALATSPDATDEASAVTLVNELKGILNAMNA